MTFTSEELRVMGMAGPVWIRMLRSREETILKRIYGEIRNGNTDHLMALAEFACVRDQINEITSAMRQNNNQKE